MPKTVTFEDPTGEGKPIELDVSVVPKDLPDYEARMDHIPTADPYYVDKTTSAVAGENDRRVYQISLDNATATSYDIVATALLDQAKDGCGNFTLTSTGVRSASGSVGSVVCW